MFINGFLNYKKGNNKYFTKLCTGLICLTTILLFNPAYGQNSFSDLPTATDSSYGYTPKNPLRLKKGNQEKSMAYSYSFISGLKTLDSQTLTLLFRATVADPNYNQAALHLNNRFTGLPANGKLGVLDKYVFVTTITKDTIQLFVDVYNKGALMLPTGLKYEKIQN